MISNLKREAFPLLKRVRLRRRSARNDTAAAKAERSKAWWSRGACGLAVAYILASQALLDIPGWSASAFVFAVLLASLMVVGAHYKVWELRLGKWLVVPLLFLAYCLLRCFPGIKDTAPFDTFAQLVSAFLGGIALAVAFRVGVSFKAVVYAQVAANLLQIIIVLSGVGPAPPPGEDSFRYAGITGNPNLLALQLTLGACLIWMLPRKAGIFPCAFAICAVAFAVAVTGSRKAVLIGLFFLVLVFIQAVAMVPKKRRRLTIALGVGTACLAGLFLGQWLYQNGGEILAVQRTLNYQDSSYRTRVEMVQEGLQLWEQAPVFGNGMDSFTGLSGQGTYAHNNYVELLCDLGLIGTLLFYALHVQVLKRAGRSPPILRLYCWVFVLTLILSDVAYVSYKSKQAIMILMLLTVVTTSRYAFHPHRHSTKRDGSRQHRLKPRLRRFVMQK